MKRIIFAVLFIAGVIFWQFFLKGYLLLPSVDRFVGSFYEQYNHRDFNYLYHVLSHQKIRSRLTQLQFERGMQSAYGKLGPVQQRKRVTWKYRRTKGNTFFFIEYKVKREKAGSTDKFVLIKKNKDWFVFDYVIRA